MASIEEIARGVLSDTGTDAGHVLCAQWIADRYVELVSKVRFRHLRKLGEVVVPATVTAGTVTLTQQSPVITPDATALAAWNALGSLNTLVGRSLRAQDTEWGIIDAVEGSTLILRTPRVQASVVGTGYWIAARSVALDTSARWLGEFVHMRRRQALLSVSLTELDLDAPWRDQLSAPPNVVAEVERAADGTKRVEFYPYPNVDELIHYVYWAIPPTLGFDDILPKEIDAYVLRDGALIDAMRYEASKAARMGKIEQAAYWRNEYRAQETSWRDSMRDAARTDRGMDDVSFIVQGMTGRRPGWGDITTAHELVWSRWAR